MSSGIATLIATVVVLVFMVIPMIVLYIYVDRQNTKTIKENWKKFTDDFEQALDGKPMSKKFIKSILTVKEQNK